MRDDILYRFRALCADPASPEPFGELSPPRLPPRVPDAETARRPLKRVALAFGAAMLAAALAVVALPTDNVETPQSGVPLPLLMASAVAAERGVPDGIAYSRTKFEGLGTTGGPGGKSFSVRAPIILTEAWVRSDGSGRLRTKQLKAKWPGPRDRARAVAAGDHHDLRWARDRPPPATDRMLSADELDRAFGPNLPPTNSLSDDAGELADQLAAAEPGGSDPADVSLFFRQVVNLLFKPNVPGPVRAAGYEVVGGIAGITVDDSAKDPLGRSTTSVSLSTNYGARSTSTLYFDPKTSRALAFTDTLAKPADFIDSLNLTTSVVTDVKTVESIPPPDR